MELLSLLFLYAYTTPEYAPTMPEQVTVEGCTVTKTPYGDIQECS